ncbi:hypothetical protein [Treponema primitia]|uniref:hypothetical protein n=1 Tax=Treponema primitia TaxID=88058 RepID=UPI0002555487|nr:hypothetical protein [Treponema primitia]
MKRKNFLSYALENKPKVGLLLAIFGMALAVGTFISCENGLGGAVDLSDLIKTETVVVTKPGEIIYETLPPEDNGKLTIKNTTEGQTIHFIRVKYPDETYKVIPANVGTGEEKVLSLPAGDYEVSISEDGVHYSSVETLAIESITDDPVGKTLDTTDNFKPPLWWKTGGHNDSSDPKYDPNYDEWNPDNPVSPNKGTDGGGTDETTTQRPYPGLGYLEVINNSNYPLDIIKVTYFAWPDGSTENLPAISLENPTNELTFTLDPQLEKEQSIILTLPAGSYKVELGYKGGNQNPSWLGKSENLVEEGKTSKVELKSEGGNSGGGTTGTTPPAETTGSYYIIVKNQYKDTIVNAINVYQVPGSAPNNTTTLAPNPTGIVVTPPLNFGDTYYYKVPTTGEYKVRMGFYDPSKPKGPGNPFWYNSPSDDTDPDHPASWTEPGDVITVGNDPNFKETNKDNSTDYSTGENNPGKNTGEKQPGAYFIAVENKYSGKTINVINVYQVPGTAQTPMVPNPSGLVFIDPLAYGETYYHQVPSKGSYKVRVGYYDETKPIGPGNPEWFNASNNDADPNDPADWVNEPVDRIVDTQPSTYHIIVINQYPGTYINVINVYQVPGIAQTPMVPNPSGLVFINPPLAFGETYYYEVPSAGSYKVRMGYYDPTKPIGPGNPWWYNASNNDLDPGDPADWVNEPKNTVVIGTNPPSVVTDNTGEIDNSNDPNNKGKITGPVATPHKWAYLKVVNTGKNKIYAVLATNRSTDDTLHPADAAHGNQPWFDYGDVTPLKGQTDMTKSAVRNLLHNSSTHLGTNAYTEEMEVPPGEMYIHVYHSSGTSKVVYHERITINTYIDVLTIVSFKDTTWETYPEYTTPTALRDNPDSVGSVTIVNRESTKGHIPIERVLITNYAEAEKVVALTDINLGLYTAYIDWREGYMPQSDTLLAGKPYPSNKKGSPRSDKIPNVLSMNQHVPPQSAINEGLFSNWNGDMVVNKKVEKVFGVPQNSSITFNLKPGLYRIAVRSAKDDHWYGGKTLYFWKAVHIREGVPTVLTYDGYHLEP